LPGVDGARRYVFVESGVGEPLFSPNQKGINEFVSGSHFAELIQHQKISATCDPLCTDKRIYSFLVWTEKVVRPPLSTTPLYLPLICPFLS
jgi:hypothetical protein